MEHDGRHIPNRLRMYRRILGFSQKHVTKMLGLKNTTFLSRWESGTLMPSIENLYKLSILYSTLSEELFREYFQSLKKVLQEKSVINSD